MSVIGDFLRQTNIIRSKMSPAKGKILDVDNKELDLTEILKALLNSDISAIRTEDKNKTSFENSIDVTAFDLQAGPFNQTTNISNGYVFEQLLLKFSTNEVKTITLTPPLGPPIHKETTTDENIVVPFGFGYKGGDNLTLTITQFTNPGTVNVKLITRQGSSVLAGNPILDPASKIQIVGSSGNPVVVKKSDDNNHYLSVVIEDGHHNIWNHYFEKETGVSTTLNGAVLANSKTLILTSAIGFSIGDSISLHSAGTHVHQFRKIINLVGLTVTLDSGVDVDIADGSNIIQTSFSLAVDGSLTPQVFNMKPRGTEIVECTRLLFNMVDNVAADDSRLGGIAGGITNGIHIRKNINNGQSYQTLAIWRTNKDMKEDMFDVVYTDKAGGGNFGTNGRWTFIKTGAIVSIDANNNEFLECVIQDDLTGLVGFQIKVQGHFEQL